MRRSMVWIPVLFVGSMVYWTLALGLGGLSLVSVTADSLPCGDGASQSAGSESSMSDSDHGDESTAKEYQSITVNLTDPLDLVEQPAGAVTVDLVSDRSSDRSSDRPVARRDQSQAVSQAVSGDQPIDADRRGSGRRSRSDQGPGETAF